MVTVRFGDPSDPHLASAMAGGNRPSESSRPAPDTSTKDLEFDVEGMTPEQARQWVDAQIPYANRADEDGVATRAVSFVKTCKERWEEGTVESREKWRSMQFMLRGGNTLASRFEDTDLHVAELYKSIESIVPRIEEAVLLQSDPYFKVVGRKELDQVISDKIGAFIRTQLHDDRFEHKVQPAIRAMLEYSFCGFKIWWDIKTEKRIKKNVEDLGVKNGKRKYRMTREEVDEVVWNGPRVRMLDPLDCIVDLGSTEAPHDARWIGDQCWMTLEEILAYGKMFGWKNLDKVQQTGERVPESGYREFDKQSRSLERFNAFDRENRVKGAPKRVRLTELWGVFDPDGGDNAVPHKILVANDSIALCVQENPNDKKGMPYAIARCSREGWEFLNVGPLDHTLSISASIDNHRNLALKSHENHLAPPLIADETAGLPDSMFDVAPGSVWQVRANSLQWMPSPSTLRDYGGMLEIERRDIEEIVGAPRIYSGSESGTGSGTATEVERKVEEGNKRIRGYVLSFSFMMQTLVRHMHALNQQWVTEDTTFRVLGKAAAHLGDYTEVGPNDLKHDVDFEFLGPSMLGNLGLRATKIQSWLAAMYPYVQMEEQKNPGSFQLATVLRESWDQMVGTMPADRIVWGDANIHDMLDQVNENTMLMGGKEVPLHPLDDDAEHLRVMESAFGDPVDQDRMEKDYGKAAAEVIAQHALMHQHAGYRKQQQDAARQKQAQQAAMQQQMQEGGGMDNGRGTTGNRRDAGGGFGQDQGGMMPPGQTPGPPRGGSIGAGDRRQPVSQPQNMSGG